MLVTSSCPDCTCVATCSPNNIRAAAIVSSPDGFGPFTQDNFNAALQYINAINIGGVPLGQAVSNTITSNGTIGPGVINAGNLTALLSSQKITCAGSGVVLTYCNSGYAFAVWRSQQVIPAGNKFNVKCYKTVCSGITPVIPVYSGTPVCCIDSTDVPIHSALPSCCSTSSPCATCSYCSCISLVNSTTVDLPVPCQAPSLWDLGQASLTFLLTLNSTC